MGSVVIKWIAVIELVGEILCPKLPITEIKKHKILDSKLVLFFQSIHSNRYRGSDLLNSTHYTKLTWGVALI